MILFVLKKHFGDTENLVYPLLPQHIHTPFEKLDRIFTGATFVEDFKILNSNVRLLNVNIPPLINIYMGLTATMKCFGTSANVDFGPVEETGIMVTVADIYDTKKERHINSFIHK
jgi:hypothetical protein